MGKVNRNSVSAVRTGTLDTLTHLHTASVFFFLKLNRYLPFIKSNIRSTGYVFNEELLSI